MAKNQFTFKTVKPTGKFRAFFENNHEIKLDGKQVGTINDGSWEIRLMVMKTPENTPNDSNPNCCWKWITLAKKSASMQEAKDFLSLTVDAIQAKYTLYKF